MQYALWSRFLSAVRPLRLSPNYPSTPTPNQPVMNHGVAEVACMNVCLFVWVRKRVCVCVCVGVHFNCGDILIYD